MKKFLIFFGFIIFLLLILIGNQSIDIPKTKTKILEYVPREILILFKTLNNGAFLKNYDYAYNVVYGPETQFLDLTLDKKKLNFVDKKWFYPFYFDFYQDSMVIVDSSGNIIIKPKIHLINNKKINANLIPTNLNDNETVMDILVHKESLILSYYLLDESEFKDCYKFGIKISNISDKFFKFEDFYKSDECGNTIQGGRLQSFNHQKNEGFLITVSDNELDYPNMSPQLDNSIFGKILFFNYDSKKYIIFSKGHRNSQGLYADQNIILSTEHGPRGGDEINNIQFGNNYGWPIASYGEKYNNEKNLQYYLKNHSKNKFKEPIYTFIPSIGINEIIKIENSFSDKWQDNFLISSLNGRSLFRLLFDNKFEKLIYHEKLFIGERIRDLKYDKENDVIFLALTESSELGILINKND